MGRFEKDKARKMAKETDREMTYEELRKLIDDAVSQLQAAADGVENAMDLVSGIDGATVTFEDAAGAPDVESLGELLGDAMSEMENAADDIANATGVLNEIL